MALSQPEDKLVGLDELQKFLPDAAAGAKKKAKAKKRQRSESESDSESWGGDDVGNMLGSDTDSDSEADEVEEATPDSPEPEPVPTPEAPRKSKKRPAEDDPEEAAENGPATWTVTSTKKGFRLLRPGHGPEEGSKMGIRKNMLEYQSAGGKKLKWDQFVKRYPGMDGIELLAIERTPRPRAADPAPAGNLEAPKATEAILCPSPKKARKQKSIRTEEAVAAKEPPKEPLKELAEMSFDEISAEVAAAKSISGGDLAQSLTELDEIRAAQHNAVLDLQSGQSIEGTLVIVSSTATALATHIRKLEEMGVPAATLVARANKGEAKIADYKPPANRLDQIRALIENLDNQLKVAMGQ